VYGRNVDDKTLSFGHTGILYRKSFVMYDRETNSHWIHTTGKCEKGEMKGKQLTFLPSIITTWGQWKKQYSDSTVLQGNGVGGMMGTYTLNQKLSRFGISVGQGDLANLYRATDLNRLRVINDTLGEKSIAVFFDREGMYAKAWQVSAGQEFSWDGENFLDPNGKAFNITTGTIEDQKEDEALVPLPATAWLVSRWKGFYKNQKVYKPPARKRSK